VTGHGSDALFGAAPVPPAGTPVPAVEPAEAPVRPSAKVVDIAGSAAAALSFPTPARAAATASADVTASTPVLPPNVPDQIVSAVVPLHGRGDGRHEVTLELRPDHLGAIRVEVSVEHQTVHLTLHAADPATGRVLAAALPDLRAALADAGLTAGHVGVGPDGGGGTAQRRPAAPGESAERGRPRRGTSAGADRTDPVRTDPVRTDSVRTAGAGRLDLLL
jgi:flagellar hook-length control protein FliK